MKHRLTLHFTNGESLVAVYPDARGPAALVERIGHFVGDNQTHAFEFIDPATGQAHEVRGRMTAMSVEACA